MARNMITKPFLRWKKVNGDFFCMRMFSSANFVFTAHNYVDEDGIVTENAEMENTRLSLAKFSSNSVLVLRLTASDP